MNVIVGENGTGKTHLMKALYAMLYAQARQAHSLDEVLLDVFQTRDTGDVISLEALPTAIAEVRGAYGGKEWTYAVQRTSGQSTVTSSNIQRTERPVFIPAIDMMGHTRGFTEAYADVRLDFDLTCSDIVNLLRLESKSAGRTPGNADVIADVLNGEIERDDSGRFYLRTDLGKLPMPMIAEGLRKVATLIQLQRNGWLVPGTTLFWDEPEVNLNPILMDNVVSAVLALARNGIQVFMATHSYLILREIEVQATKADCFRYFSLYRSQDGVRVNQANTYLEMHPNAIESQYADLYDRGIDKQLSSVEGRA